MKKEQFLDYSSRKGGERVTIYIPSKGDIEFWADNRDFVSMPCPTIERDKGNGFPSQVYDLVAKEDLATRLEVDDLKARLALRNRQIRDLRRQLRK